MQLADKPDIAAIFSDARRIERALNEGVRQAYIRHKKLGLPIVVWENGRVVEIPPEEIPDDGVSWPDGAGD
jgi:hypothetical protein